MSMPPEKYRRIKTKKQQQIVSQTRGKTTDDDEY